MFSKEGIISGREKVMADIKINPINNINTAPAPAVKNNVRNANGAQGPDRTAASNAADKAKEFWELMTEVD